MIKLKKVSYPQRDFPPTLSTPVPSEKERKDPQRDCMFWRNTTALDQLEDI